MTVQELINTNTHLSWICQEMGIEPSIMISKSDVTPNGYIDIQYRHSSDVDGNTFAKEFEELLDESFRHAEVYVSDKEEGEWFDLNISFKYDSLKQRVYKEDYLMA